MAKRKARVGVKGKDVRNDLKLVEEMTYLSKERTILAKEQTILSFMRTGLAFIGAGIVVVNFFPAHATQVVGWALIAIGFIEVFESYRRLSRYRKRMEHIKKRLGRERV